MSGETGSGKTTQLPKICMQLGRGVAGMIGHTQPRRLAARSVADRIADELGQTVGRESGQVVGYQVRFTDEVGPTTLVKLMTDGILLAEIQSDPMLRRYDTLIIDEAHERSLNIDFILGYLARLLPARPDLKVIITSATIDSGRFARHFGTWEGTPGSGRLIEPAPVIEVSGRTYPVEIRYRPLGPTTPSSYTSEASAQAEKPIEVIETTDVTESGPMQLVLEDPDDELATLGYGMGEDIDVETAICHAVDELSAEGDGDILVFLPGERDIRDTEAALLDHLKGRGRRAGDDKGARPGDIEILPLYARLTAAEQHRVFEPHRLRRVVLATNVAETSLTVPGIRYVIDPGLARISRYSNKTKVQRLPIEPVSQASANQRAGRCGRVAEGVAIRLFSQADYLSRPRFTEPEILRTSLASVILQMASLGLGAVEDFPFLDAPDRRAVRDGVALLVEIGALAQDSGTEDGAPASSQYRLTGIGRDLARLPIDPRLGRMLLEAERLGCASEVLVIVAALSIQDVRERPAEHQGTASVDADQVHRSLLVGLLSYLGSWDETRRDYEGARGTHFTIWPGSGVSGHPAWVMTAELVETSRLFARTVARIRPEWVEPAARGLLKRSYSEPFWSVGKGAAMVRERVTLYGLTLAADREVLLGRLGDLVIDEAVAASRSHAPRAGSLEALAAGLVSAPKDPLSSGSFEPRHFEELAAAREGKTARELAREMFIRNALVDGQWRERHAFQRRNEALVEQAREVERRSRTHGLVADEQARFRFFDDLIPEHVTSAAAFNRWWKDERREHPDLLIYPASLLMPREATSGEGFPDRWQCGELSLPLSYEFAPDSPRDGVSMRIPIEVLERVSDAGTDWLVPGMREDLLTEAIRALPKGVRRLLAPAPDVAASVARWIEQAGDEPALAVAASADKSAGKAKAAESDEPDPLSLDAAMGHLAAWGATSGKLSTRNSPAKAPKKAAQKETPEQAQATQGPEAAAEAPKSRPLTEGSVLDALAHAVRVLRGVDLSEADLAHARAHLPDHLRMTFVVTDASGKELGAGKDLAYLQRSLASDANKAVRTAVRAAGVLHIVRDGQIIGAVAVEDKIRPESRAAVKALQDRGVKVAMITGDAQQVAHAVGQDLGIDEVFAEVLPQDKDTKVTQLQERGLSVAMVGDGVNDAPALARAEVGIAIGAGTDVAMESAGVVLASDDPRAILSMIELSQASYRKMIQNLIWASGYNILSVPLAAGVLASSGILLPPAAAAVLMSLSTIVVALNAQLLRRIDLDPAHLAPTSPKEEHTTPTPASTAVH